MRMVYDGNRCRMAMEAFKRMGYQVDVVGLMGEEKRTGGERRD